MASADHQESRGWLRPPASGGVLLGCVGGMMFFLAAGALASPPQTTDPLLAPWFRSLTNPAYAGESCCAEADGHILGDAEWRENGDQYEIHVSGTWWPVPPKSVLDHVPNPTGGAVAFWQMHGHGPTEGPRIYCFVRPAEG